VSPTAIGLILVAAVAHASWNLFSKQASVTGAVSFIWLVSATATALYAPVIAIDVIVTRPHLSGLSWIFLAGTGVLQAAYFLFLQRGYRLGDLSLVYPIGRGTGALLAALAGIFLLGERPGPVAIAGIGCIVAGIIVIGIPGRAGSAPGQAGSAAGRAGSAVPAAAAGIARPALSPARATAFALLTGAFIASYTLWDKYAVGTLRTPPLLQGFAAFPIMVLVFALPAAHAGDRTARVWRDYRPQVIGAAVLAPFAYILVLIALSFTAVAAVAPAREVSVLFGVLLGRRLLGEGNLARRVAAAAAIVVGIVAIAIG
jgi:drug/metabolite transporter (DMT)-like permease